MGIYKINKSERVTRKEERKMRKVGKIILRKRRYVSKRGRKKKRGTRHSERDDKREGKRSTTSATKRGDKKVEVQCHVQRMQIPWIPRYLTRKCKERESEKKHVKKFDICQNISSIIYNFVYLNDIKTLFSF